MKSLFQAITALLFLAVCLVPVHLARAQDDQDQGDDQSASFQTFYDQLSSQGNWVQTDDYGYVWQPQESDPDWAPYTEGHWVYTDDGWTWVSDEDFGWATYHYGRWANIEGTGWVWVPGYRWAPAWVSWRYGGGYAGWAPLPPETIYGAEYGDGGDDQGFHFGGDVDVSFGIGAGCYNFIEIGDFGDNDYRGHYRNRYDNYRIINQTTNITNINVNHGRRGFNAVSAGGPQLSDVNSHSREPVRTMQLTRSNAAGRASLNGNSLAVYAPRINPNSRNNARPGNVAGTIAHPTFNRGNSIDHPLQVRSGLTPPAPSQTQIAAAHDATLHVPTSAKIATGNAAPRQTFNKPLNTLQPVIHTAAVPSSTSTAPRTEIHAAGANPTFTGQPATRENNAPNGGDYRPGNNRPSTGGETSTPVTYRENSNVAPQQRTSTFQPQAAPTPAPQEHASTFHPEATPTPTETRAESAPVHHESTGGGGGNQYHPSEAPHPQAQQQSHPSGGGGNQGGGGQGGGKKGKDDNHH
jgi:hypothetical protein